MTDFFIPRQEYRDVAFYVAFDEYDCIYYVDACPRCNFSISEYLSFTRWYKKMKSYVGSVDFSNGDFILRHIPAQNIFEANNIFRSHITKEYGDRLKDITKLSVSDMRYIERCFNEY